MARQPNQDPPRTTRRSSARNKAPPQTSTSSSSIPDLQAPVISSGRPVQKKPRPQGLASSKTSMTALVSSQKRKREDAEEGRTEDEASDLAPAAPAPPSKRHKQAPTPLRCQGLGSSTGTTSVAPPKARVSSRTTRVQVQTRDDAPALRDDDDSAFAPTASSSSLSDAHPAPRYSSASAIAKAQALTRDRPQKNFMIPPKSHLTLREEDEARAARDVQKRKAEKSAVSTRQPHSQSIQNRFQLKAELNAKDTEAATVQPKGKLDAKAKRELEKQQKAAELDALAKMTIPVPLPYKLQLPALPKRQNHTGRHLKLKLLAHDPTFPPSPKVRELFVSWLMNCIRDCRIAQDRVTVTTNYWHVWLKPIHDGTYTYEEVDMERVCRKLVNIAEALHDHGLGATDIYCPETIRKTMAAKPIRFADRVLRLGTLMRKTKARCNDFMLGNTLEDTVALIDLKLSDQKSNNANNYLRSVKVEETNKYLQMPKGTKWPKDQNGKPLPPSELQARGYGTTEGLVSDEVNDEQDALGKGGEWQPAGSVQQVHFSDPAFAHYQGVSQDQKPALDWLADMDMSQLGVASPFDITNVQSPHAFSPTAFDGLLGHVSEVESAHGNFWQPSAGPQLFASMHPAQTESPFSSFQGSSMSSAHDGFDNSSTGDVQQMDTQVGMPPLPQYNTFAGYEQMSQHPQPFSVYDARPEPTRVFVSGRAEHELLESRMCRHESYAFEPNPVTRTAKHKTSRGLDEQQGEGTAEPVNKRQRRGKAEADASKNPQGVSANALLCGQSAKPSAKRGGGRRVAGLSKSRAPAREDSMLRKVADAEKVGRAREADGKEGEGYVDCAVKQ